MGKQLLLPRNQCVDNLSEIVARCGQNVRKFFSKQIEECLISTENDAFLDKDLHCKENENLSEQHLLSQISKLLRKPNEEKIWQKISILRIEYHAKILNEQILCKLKNLMYDEMMLSEKIEAIKRESDNLIIERCKKYCSRMDGVLQDIFDNFFNKDPENGIPRRWDDSVNIDEIFLNAKQQCLQVLNLSQQIILSPNSDLALDEIKLTLLSSDTLDDIRSDFLRFADNEYRRAQAAIQHSGMIGGGLLPTHPVSWLIFLFFAKDELWTMLTNPLYLILFVFGAAILVIGYQAHVYGFDVQTIIMQLIQ